MGYIAEGQKASVWRAGIWTRVQILQCCLPVRHPAPDILVPWSSYTIVPPWPGGGLPKSFQSPRLLPTQDPAHAVPSAWDAFLSPLPGILPRLTLLMFQVSDTMTVPPRCLPWSPHKVSNHAPCRFTQTPSPGSCSADDPCQASLTRAPELEDLARFAVHVSSHLVRGRRSVQTCGRDRLTARWSPSLRLY